VTCLCAQFESVLQHESIFWYYVKEVLNKHELQRFYSLRNITTDTGRGRAWLRCALNEHSLERYLHMLLADKNHLSMIPTMAAGLNSILFAINIDNKDLNGPSKCPPSVSDLLKESTQNVTSLLKESTQGVSTLLREITSSSPGTVAGEDSEDGCDRLSASAASSVTEQMDLLPGNQDDTSLKHHSQYLNGDCSYLKLDVKSIDDEEAEENEENHARTLRNRSETWKTATNTKMQIFQVETGSPVHKNALTELLPLDSVPESMTVEELRQAIVAMMNRKHELEEQTSSLRSLLEGEMEHSAGLRQEVDNLKKKLSEHEEHYTNEVLKVQLKKYVGAVQMLKR
ncbi:putative Sorting nexin-29 isoform X1 protein, partial [Naja naja]